MNQISHVYICENPVYLSRSTGLQLEMSNAQTKTIAGSDEYTSGSIRQYSYVVETKCGCKLAIMKLLLASIQRSRTTESLENGSGELIVFTIW